MHSLRSSLAMRRGAGAAVRRQGTAAGRAVLSRDDPGCDALNNVPPHVAARVGAQLHHAERHPLGMIKRVIEGHFAREGGELEGAPTFEFFDDFSPVVTTQQCFDDLLVPADHVSRSRNDTFYVDAERCLRTHTSAHQCELIRAGRDAFLCTGDVYRKDTVDASHAPVFHQMEGVRIFSNDVARDVVERDLKRALEGTVRALFGELTPSEMRWNTDYFPFTDPSFELEIFYEGEWLEVLGCGVVEQDILERCGRPDAVGWAFGLGLERLAMVRFGIPDIRLFWSTDPRFLGQFDIDSAPGDEVPALTFAPFSKYPPCFKDVSFWIGDDAAFHENQVHEVVLSSAGEMIETVDLIDEFVHPKSGRRSQCYRLTYRSMERSLVNEEVDAMQENVRADLVDKLAVELR